MRYYPPREPRSPAGHWSPHRDRATQARFRRTVLAKAGHRCQWIEHGERCITTEYLQAHHLEPGNQDPDTGVALCRTHHRAIDAHAR